METYHLRKLRPVMSVKTVLLIMQLMAGILSGPLSRSRCFELYTMYLVVDSVAEHSDNMCSVCHRLGQMDRQWEIMAASQSILTTYMNESHISRIFAFGCIRWCEHK